MTTSRILGSVIGGALAAAALVAAPAAQAFQSPVTLAEARNLGPEVGGVPAGALGKVRNELAGVPNIGPGVGEVAASTLPYATEDA